MLDTLNTVATASSDLATVMPYIGTGGASVAVIFGIIYREVIIDLLKRLIGKNRDEERKSIMEDVKALKDNLDTHTEVEAKYWAENEKRLTKLEMDAELNKQQAKGQHEETLRILGQQNERLGDLADSVKMLTQTLLQDRK